MPTSPISSDGLSVPAGANKKRNRTSLLSIISTDKKPSTSSSEGLVSPTRSTPPISPATSPPPLSPTPSTDGKTEGKTEVTDNSSNRKSAVPPPVSVKPKAKPPATAQKPSRPESTVPVASVVIESPPSPTAVTDNENNNVSPISSPDEKIQIEETAKLELSPAEIDVAVPEPLSVESNPTIIKTDNNSAGTIEADTLTQQPSSDLNTTSVVTEVEAKVVAEERSADLNATIESLPPPPPELTGTEELSVSSGGKTSMENLDTSADMDESMDFPPPPPEDDFPAPPPDLSAEVEVLPPPAIEEEDTSISNQQAPPPITSDSTLAMQEAVDKIESKYDVSPVTQIMSNAKYQSDETQNPDTCETVDNSAHSDSSVALSPADKIAQSPVGLLSGDSNSPVISATADVHKTDNESTSKAVDEVDRAVIASPSEPLSLQLNSELAASIGAKSPSISSPISEVSQDNSAMSHADGEPPVAAENVEASEDNAPTTEENTESKGMSVNGELTKANVLTVAKVQESELQHSSSGTPTHSPPFNTSSESGDSGCYSLVGETVQVKLRPTTNDNRKADQAAVPMHDRTSGGDLKRVTFRDTSNQQQITPAVVQRSAREEERIKRTGLSDQDVSQTELFYKAHKTEVMVCPCLATLYFAEGASGDSINMDEWKPEHIGIPVIIYDTGDGKRNRGLTLVFAEKGTGFSLWKTVINYESRWEIVENVFHRLRVPGTAEQLAGMAFQDEESATSFYNFYKDCTADPEKNVLNNPNIRNKKKKEKKKPNKSKPTPLPSKTAISRPCEFQHVTQLKQSEDGILALSMVPADEEGMEDGMR